MADGKVTETLFFFVGRSGPGVLPLQSRRSVRFVSNHHTRSDAGAQQGFRYPIAALVSANENLDSVVDGALAHPVGYFPGVGCHPALHLGRADIAVIDGRVERGVAPSLFPGVVACGGVRADRQHIYRDRGVLQSIRA